MNPIYESSTYLTLIRPPTKSVSHCCTGETELQRISKNICYLNLQYSLKHSKMLQRFINQNPLDQRYSEQQFEELCQIKSIVIQQNKYYLKKALQEYQCYRIAINFIETMRLEKYDKKNQLHENLLLQLWANLMPKQKLVDRISNQWIEIGFQTNDPATDFRGAGMLGLWNLVLFSRQKKCQGVLKWALYQDTAYFFCSAGLYLTMTALQLSKQMTVPVQHWQFGHNSQILHKFQLVYNMLFMQFDTYWKHCQDKSIMAFNNNLNQFKKSIKELSVDQVKEKIIMWADV